MNILFVPDDFGSLVNVHKLENYESVEKVFIDIANDPAKCKPALNPKLVLSEKTGRGKLGPNWITESKEKDGPKMCCYISAEVFLQIPAMQSKVESIIQTSVRTILIERQREIFCSMDTWYDMDVESIPKLEVKLPAT